MILELAGLRNGRDRRQEQLHRLALTPSFGMPNPQILSEMLTF
jgi:hypothetical protein